MYQGVVYCQDLKLGHYMKVPPRTLFFGQAVASLWGCLVQVAVLYWSFGSISNICDLKQSARFTCPNGRVFFNASIIWGLIGPQRIFSSQGVYGNLQYFWILGAFLPVVFYAVARRFPGGPARFLHAAIILGGTSYIPPATPMNYLAWVCICGSHFTWPQLITCVGYRRLRFQQADSKPSPRLVAYVQLCDLRSVGRGSGTLHHPHILFPATAQSRPSEVVGQ